MFEVKITYELTKTQSREKRLKVISFSQALRENLKSYLCICGITFELSFSFSLKRKSSQEISLSLKIAITIEPCNTRCLNSAAGK